MPVDPVPASYVGALLTAVREFDRGRVGAVLDDADATHGLDTTIDEVVFPALRLVGTFWASGTMDIAHEHLLSTAVARWVNARAAVPPGVARRGTILLAAGPQDMHTLALDCLDLLLTSRGVEVCNLGAQTPVASLLVAARFVSPTAVVLSSQNPTIAGDAVRAVQAMAEAGLPVYLAGSSFFLQHFRENAPGTPLDGTLRESADLLAARHTTPLPLPTGTAGDSRAAAALVARAVFVARTVQVIEAAESVARASRAVGEASTITARAAERARASRAEAARSAAETVAGSADRAAAGVRRQVDVSAAALREATARAAAAVAASSPSGDDREAALAALHLAAAAHDAAEQEAAEAAEGVATTVAAAAARMARTVSELDAAIEKEVSDTAAQVRTTAATTARELAAETGARATSIASVAREAAAAADVADAHHLAQQGPHLGDGPDDAGGRTARTPR